MNLGLGGRGGPDHGDLVFGRAEDFSLLGARHGAVEIGRKLILLGTILLWQMARARQVGRTLHSAWPIAALILLAATYYGGGYGSPIYRNRKGATVQLDTPSAPNAKAIARPVNVNTVTVARSGFGGSGRSRGFGG
mgnify:CR=1 FL=1